MTKIITQMFHMFEWLSGEKELLWLQRAEQGRGGQRVGEANLAPQEVVFSNQNCPAWTSCTG